MTDTVLFERNRHYGSVSPTVASAIDAAVAVIIAHERSEALGKDLFDSLLSTSFIGTSSLFAFESSTKARTGAYFDVTFTDPEVDGTPSAVFGVWAQSIFTFIVKLPSLGAVTSAPLANICSVTCPKCDRSLIIPIVIGLMCFLVAITIIFYCGRQRVGVSLFEQTAQAEHDAQVAMREAEVKSSFLANMSHEIRTPLHAILSMGRMLMESRQADPNASLQDLEDLSQIIKSSETLEALVNDILFISKMQTASFELGNRQFDVCELLEDIIQLLALRYTTKNVECATSFHLPEFSFQVFFRRT